MPAHRPDDTAGAGASVCPSRDRVEHTKNASALTVLLFSSLTLLSSVSSLRNTSALINHHSTSMLIASPSSAPSHSRPRSSSDPRGGDAHQDRSSTATDQLESEMTAVADFTEQHPLAKDIIRACLKAGLPVAVALERTKAAFTPARPHPQRGSPGPRCSVDIGPRTPTRRTAATSGISSSPVRRSPRNHSARVAGPASLSSKRLASETNEELGSNKRARSGAWDLTTLTDADFTGSNDAQFDQLWPPARICNMVKEGKFVQLWHFSPAGMHYAATSKKTGDEETMTLQQDGSLRPVVLSAAPIDDWALDPHDFVIATKKWVDVARREGLSTAIQQQMIRLNHAIINDPQWRTHAKDRMEWHAFQRAEWSNRLQSGRDLFPLHALQDKHYDAIREARTRAIATAAWEAASSALAMAQQHQRNGAGDAGPSR
ncbi:hypothetical protein V8E36_007449 [Tilletia maclaganii]